MDNQTKTQTNEIDDEIKEVFLTHEQGLIAYLFCCHFHLKHSPYLLGPMVVFPFKRSPELDQEVENFRNKKYNPKVELKKYGVKIKEVQAMIHYYRRLEEVGITEEEGK